MEILIAALTGGLASGVMTIIHSCLQRKWKKEDSKDERIDALVFAQRVTMIDRVKHLGKHYIDDGEISLEDKENFQEMYRAYKGLNGNGHLDTVMREVDKLKVVGDLHENE
jgi:hypothetical protein